MRDQAVDLDGSTRDQAERLASTTTADLWAALEKASGKPVRALSAGWTEQPGLPVINISSQCDGGKDIVRLEQERFTVQDRAQSRCNGWCPWRWRI